MECLLIKVNYITTTLPPRSGIDYYTVIKKERDGDITFHYYVLYNKSGHIFKKKLSKYLVSRLLRFRSGNVSLFEFCGNDGEFIKLVKSMYSTVMECTMLFRYNL